MGYLPLTWTATQWNVYAILLGLLFSVFGNFWANSMLRYREEQAKAMGKPLNYGYEAKWGVVALFVVIILLLILLFFWPS